MSIIKQNVTFLTNFTLVSHSVNALCTVPSLTHHTQPGVPVHSCICPTRTLTSGTVKNGAGVLAAHAVVAISVVALVAENRARLTKIRSAVEGQSGLTDALAAHDRCMSGVHTLLADAL